eukprot:8203500-Pyramimonas_sp.AAC.1
MRDLDIAVACLQETRCRGSPVCEFQGHFFIVSGGEDDAWEHSGVGFVAAPWATRSGEGYLQHYNRMASSRIRVTGGA